MRGGGPCKRSPVIAGGGGDEARRRRAVLFSEAQDRVERAADLERERRLQDLELEPNLRGRQRAEPRRPAKRCSEDASVQTRGGRANLADGQGWLVLSVRRMSAS